MAKNGRSPANRKTRKPAKQIKSIRTAVTRNARPLGLGLLAVALTGIVAGTTAAVRRGLVSWPGYGGNVRSPDLGES